ncbi:MAG: hypothetical protein ACYTEQ_29795, partial [Planctomycetota bacterium]
MIAFTANASVMTVQWTSNRTDIDFTDVVNLTAGVGVSVRFPTRSEYVAIRFDGTGGTVIRYQTGFRAAGASASVIANLGTGAKILKTEVPGLRSLISSDASATITELSEEIDITMTAATVSLASAGGTETLVADGVGPDLETKGLSAGAGISLLGAVGVVTITNDSPGSDVTLASAGGTETLIQDGVGPALANKGLTAGTGVTLLGGANDVTITNASPASSVTLVSAGGTETLIQDGVGPALANKGLTAGTGVTLLGGANDV